MAANPPNPELAALPARKLFLANPENRAFMEGRVPRAWITNSHTLSVIAQVMIALTIVGGVATLLLTFGNSLWLVCGIVPLLLGIGSFWLENRMYRDKHLLKQGILLKGEIIRWDLRYIEVGRSWFASEDGEDEYGDAVLQPTLYYAFTTPNGHTIQGQRITSLADHFYCPQPGTPIAVLYVNDKLYEVL